MAASAKGKWIYPLDEFYAQAGLALPAVELVPSYEVPEPYRSLLVHTQDMTPTLEGAYGGNIQLRVLQAGLAGQVLSREVVLTPEGGTKPVAFGVIKINLEHLPEAARRLVLEGKRPLGAVLRGESIEHESHPDRYLRVAADPLILGALDLSTPCVLYGRRNVITDAAQRTLAHVVEILPPSNGFADVK
jgi:chorismate-pyruvate lyase